MSTDSLAILVSNDGTEVRATLLAVKQSITIGTMLEILDEEQTTDLPIPVPSVDGKTLEKVLEWCEHHRDDKILEDDNFEGVFGSSFKDPMEVPAVTKVPSWDAEFLKNVDDEMLRNIVIAADYLEIPLLQKYVTVTIAYRMRDMEPEQMRQLLGIVNDYTPEEIEEIKAVHAWVHETLNH
ncbi:E3 ubiquitin ligase SCF complex, Skp subunit [Xylariaceae sp. AK1471]|nr:E3 ubiquitin ligase SCF complex, Skp subunit [Xylariaceae sp. AK1471]